MGVILRLFSNSEDLFKKRKISNILDDYFMLLLTDKDFVKKIKPILEDKEIPKPKWLKLLRKIKEDIIEAVAESDAEDKYTDVEIYYYDYDLFDMFYCFEYTNMDEINLSVAKSTNPAAFASSSSYSGGGGCACACACACAGGGR